MITGHSIPTGPANPTFACVTRSTSAKSANSISVAFNSFNTLVSFSSLFPLKEKHMFFHLHDKSMS